MTVLNALPTTNTLFHSHSDLTRQAEELESHASALRQADSCQRLILEDLIRFARSFARDIDEHMTEEEQRVFPSYGHLLNSSTRALLEEIHAQHRELEKSVAILMNFLDAAENAPELDDDLIESIYVRARLVRYSFSLHSESERQFFTEVAQAESTP